MISINVIIIGIVLLFGSFLVLRSLFSVKVCALCASVFATWVFLLGYLYLGNGVDLSMIAILMGGSIVGFMYLLEKKLPDKYSILKLPFFLSLFVLAYFLLQGNIYYQSIILLIVIWILFLLVFLFRNNEKMKIMSKKIIECCKNW